MWFNDQEKGQEPASFGHCIQRLQKNTRSQRPKLSGPSFRADANGCFDFQASHRNKRASEVFPRATKVNVVPAIFDEIRADDLVAWAERIESAHLMPSLIRQLIAASGAKLTRCRFLTHEQTNLGGWDAEIGAESSGLFVRCSQNIGNTFGSEHG